MESQTSRLRSHVSPAAAILAVCLLCLPTFGACQQLGTATTPAPVKDILLARPFTLDTPYANTWSKGGAQVSKGVLVVLAVDPAYVVPRNALEPVLYAGDVAVQRLNQGDRSGRVIGIVPADIDLATSPIWFGSPELPERVTESVIRSERALAEKAGVRPFASTRIASVRRPPLVAKDLAELLRTVGAQLVYEFSPQEKELADAWRRPVAKAPPKKND